MIDKPPQALHLAATLRHLGARDAALLRCVDVVAFAGGAIEVVARCQPFDDGAHRAVLHLDPRRHAALALRLHFHDGRSRLCPATPLCACRCHGLAIVQFDAMEGCGRWCFGPDDDMRSVQSGAMEPHWHQEAQKSGVAAPSQRLAADAASVPSWLQGLLPGAGAPRPRPTEEAPAGAPTLSALGWPTSAAAAVAEDGGLAMMPKAGGERAAMTVAAIAPGEFRAGDSRMDGARAGDRAGSTMRANVRAGGATVAELGGERGGDGRGGDGRGAHVANVDGQRSAPPPTSRVTPEPPRAMLDPRAQRFVPTTPQRTVR